MSVHIVMPEMGEGVIEGTVVSWLKREGDAVRVDDPVLEIETDKVTVEVTAEAEGVLLKTLVPEGATVAVGAPLAVIGAAGETVIDPPAAAEATPVSSPKDAPPEPAANDPAPATRPTPAVHVQAAPVISRKPNGLRLSPVVARMAQEHNLDLSLIEGTGRNGRITKKDVLAYMDAQAAPAPPPVAAPAPAPVSPEAAPAAMDGDLVPLTGMRRAIAEHMVMSKRESPHVTTVFEFDYSAVAAHRAAHKAQFARDGARLSYMPYLILATVEALKQHPMVNAMWTDEGVLLKRAINISMATAVDAGLITPVIKNADSMNLLGLARAVNDLADRARANKLTPAEVKGGTFTITNHGASGSLIGTPIINQPQVGILGVGLIEKRAKVINDAIAIRPCAYVSFSFDHRILDGATADAFVASIKARIENWA